MLLLERPCVVAIGDDVLHQRKVVGHANQARFHRHLPQAHDLGAHHEIMTLVRSVIDSSDSLPIGFSASGM